VYALDLPAPRYAIELAVTLFPPDSGDCFPGTSLNLSETGVLIRTARWEPPGAVLNLKFPTFGCAAAVVWNSDPKGEVGVLLGMRFVSLRDEDLMALALMLGIPGEHHKVSTAGIS